VLGMSVFLVVGRGKVGCRDAAQSCFTESYDP
jgi:hypothetical protein